jgi:hypothetical protein
MALDYILESPTHLSILLEAAVETPQANANRSIVHPSHLITQFLTVR